MAGVESVVKRMAWEPVVSIISREIVVPVKPTERQSYFLSCLDIFWKSFHYNQRVIFYDQSTVLSGQAVMEKLKSSLALCLVHYYPLCGRLSPAAHRLFIDCNDAGVEFVEASVHLPLSLLSHQAFQIRPFFQHLCQNLNHSGDCLYSSPLLSIQATVFSDGGLALGITQSHVVVDGQALWNFMVSWGECARGLPLSLPPVLDRERLAVLNPSLEKATWKLNLKTKDEDMDTRNNIESVGMHSSSEDNKVAAQIDPSASAIAEASLDQHIIPCMFNLPSSAVKKLKIEDGGVHSSYEVTCAHLWQRLTTARRRPSLEPTYFVILANCRSHVTPPLPCAYFGNAIVFGVSVSTTRKICSESLHATASRIHDTIVEITQDSFVQSFMHWLEIHDTDLLSAALLTVNKNVVNVAASPRFPIYEVDFGWGKPMAVRSPKVPDGEMVFSGGNPKSAPGDVEICMGLPSDVLGRLLEDPSFLGITPCSPFHLV